MALGLTPQQIIDKESHPLLKISARWVRITLKDLAKVQNGCAFSSEYFNHADGVPLIRIRDIDRPKTENLYSGEFSEEFIVNHNDILIGMDGDFNVSKWPGKKGLLNQRVCRIIFFSENYEKEFLYLCLQPYLNAINEETSAVTVKHLSSRTVLDIPLPLPPLPEQRAIVAKIEKLFSDLDNGIANFKAAKSKLDIYRHALLKKAFEGELTKAWLKHREVKAFDPETEKADNLPKGWSVVKLGKVADLCLGKMLDKAKNFGELNPYLGNINVRWGTFDLTNLKTMKFQNTELERYSVKNGDLIICEGGEPGRCAVWTKLSSIYIQKALHRVRFELGYNPFYFHYYIKFIASSGQLEKYFTGTTIKHLTGTKLREIKVPVPTLEEQTTIVAAIESRLSVCDKLAESIDQSLEKAEALRQRILKKAFAGKLLSEAELAACRRETDWEPAQKLLERIKWDKAVGAKNAATGKSWKANNK